MHVAEHGSDKPALKMIFQKYSMMHAKLSLKLMFTLEVDASESSNGNVTQQMKLTPAERNYNIENWEWLAVKTGLEE